jgi:hypothetical protein
VTATAAAASPVTQAAAVTVVQAGPSQHSGTTPNQRITSQKRTARSATTKAASASTSTATRAAGLIDVAQRCGVLRMRLLSTAGLCVQGNGLCGVVLRL